MCTFWLVEALTRAGRTDPARLDQARMIFEKMLGYTNHLGLFAEQISNRDVQIVVIQRQHVAERALARPIGPTEPDYSFAVCHVLDIVPGLALDVIVQFLGVAVLA